MPSVPLPHSLPTTTTHPTLPHTHTHTHKIGMLVTLDIQKKSCHSEPVVYISVPCGSCEFLGCDKYIKIFIHQDHVLQSSPTTKMVLYASPVPPSSSLSQLATLPPYLFTFPEYDMIGNTVWLFALTFPLGTCTGK